MILMSASGYDTIFRLYIVVGLIVLALAAFFVYKKISGDKIFLFLILGVGSVLLFVEPIFATPDEPLHYANAYQISSFFYGEEFGVGYSTRRTIDWLPPYKDSELTKEGYDRYVSSFGGNQDKSTYVFFDNYATGSSKLLYLFSGVGVTLARVFQTSFGTLSIMGALGNLLFYAFMLYYSAKIIPVGKRVIYVLGLMPMCMQQATSYSYDAVLIPCAILIIAMALRVSQDKAFRLRWWDILFAGFSFLVLFVAKGKAYFPIAIAAGIIIFKKSWLDKKYKKYWLAIGSVAVMGIVVFFCVLHGGERILGLLHMEPTINRSGNLSYAPIYYFTHIKETFSIFSNTLTTRGSDYLYEMVGGKLGWLQVWLHPVLMKLIMLLLMLSCIRRPEEKSLPIIKRILVTGCAFFAILLPMFAMLIFETEKTSVVIEGFQGRYMLPSVLPFCISVFFWKKPLLSTEKIKDVYFAVVAGILLYISYIDFLVKIT
ncbi:MAG: DUF2142 domain-containing protein [Lachnospiraceae bacterium]|nr:DUF2142 domain-containing protein [Lachnospiraceae bacterium]